MSDLVMTLRCRTCSKREIVSGELLSALITAMRELGWTAQDCCPDCSRAEAAQQAEAAS